MVNDGTINWDCREIWSACCYAYWDELWNDTDIQRMDATYSIIAKLTGNGLKEK